MEALLALGGVAWVLISIFLGLLPLIAMWRVFEKAGQPGWAILVPIYNIIVILKTAGKPGWWFFLFLIPIVNVIFLVLTFHGISVRFGHGAGFTVGMLFLPFIFLLILAFSNQVYTPIVENN